ncbi:multidrug efflux RND transporter permease subunit [Sphingomonas montanisoli]|uniref:Efflux pump membrane transporter n=1 Tax=Sphingomonas montanisoli TaxID=2606412 RepID=A0A5D9C5G5_9SPHN|nr:multidrug efflux RND transporter permease subunit [Sphingomonas montanisoli]
MSRFFIDRPVFAWVIALGILLSGIMALRALPIEQYPTVAPPSVTVSVTYPGADAKTLETNVTQPIEQELNGVPGFLYMSSTSLSNGTASIQVTFKAGTDIDIAQVELQNRLRRVEQRLPEEVRRQGILVNKVSGSFLGIIALTSKSGNTTPLELGNVANTQVIDEIRRLPGVADVRLFGAQYAMRIWLDPDKLASYKLSPSDALTAVQEQNSQTAGGQVGDQPLANNAELNATIITQNRFTSDEQFKDIILRANPDGSTIRLRDVARIELGASSYVTGNELNEKPMVGLGIEPSPDANSLETVRAINERMKELEAGLPADVQWSVPFDITPFINASIHEVVVTLIEAMILVFLVMYLFLQNWRATLIPTLVVPIALAGACLGLWVAGFSINVLSLFGMVLAIGILVDDAIVVIENVERIMAEEHLGPREATIKAMGQITGAIIGITLVLMAVFVPMAFFPGSTGGIYRQFSVTLIVSIAFSALLALSLTPALCATMLKPHVEGQTRSSRMLPVMDRFFAWFERFFGRATKRYVGGVGKILAAPVRWLAVFVLLVALTAFLYLRVPGGFLPSEDQGYVISIVQGPPGATIERTNEATTQMQQFFKAQPQVERRVMLRGFSFFGQGQSAAMMFSSLHPWDERKGTENSADTLVGKAMGALMQVKEAMIFTINPPPISQLGNASGFSFRLEDRGGMGQEALTQARNQLLGMAAQSSVLTGVRPEGMEPAPQLHVDIDRVKARALGLSITDVNATLAITFGSGYANDFTHNGRVQQVLLMADAAYRMTPADVLNLRVRNDKGEMVPFGAFTTAEWTSGPPQLQRYNGYGSATISGTPAAGHSTGEAMDEMERLAGQLPQGFSYEWTGISYEERESAGQVPLLLSLSLLAVFLLLAALYESWAVPVAVLLVVPLGVLGAVMLTSLRGLSADVYFQVGLITIIGLSAKNAILIVEFAIEEEATGKSILDATLSAVRLRLRPIIMTSMAFILGMLPLFIATGAGAASRRAVGTGVMGGMVAATIFGIFFVPLFYLAIRRWVSRKDPTSVAAHPEDVDPKPAGEGGSHHA